MHRDNDDDGNGDGDADNIDSAARWICYLR